MPPNLDLALDEDSEDYVPVAAGGGGGLGPHDWDDGSGNAWDDGTAAHWTDN